LDYYLEIPSKISSINEVRIFLEKVVSSEGLSRKVFNRVFLGIDEILLNSIIHGNAMDISKIVRIKIQLTADLVKIVVSDEGNGFAIEQIESPTSAQNIKKENGRGIFLVRQTADEVLFMEEGRSVALTYKIANGNQVF
jgi:serine/threonine-protein kinase RsbW